MFRRTFRRQAAFFRKARFPIPADMSARAGNRDCLNQTSFAPENSDNRRIFDLKSLRSRKPQTDWASQIIDRRPTGVPLEIYCFAKEVNWAPYEKVQSEITEHLLAVLPSFRLRVFQRSSDIQEIGSQIDIAGGALRFARDRKIRGLRTMETPPANGIHSPAAEKLIPAGPGSGVRRAGNGWSPSFRRPARNRRRTPRRARGRPAG